VTRCSPTTVALALASSSGPAPVAHARSDEHGRDGDQTGKADDRCGTPACANGAQRARYGGPNGTRGVGICEVSPRSGGRDHRAAAGRSQGGRPGIPFAGRRRLPARRPASSAPVQR
jgi:hypothetical protein